jgi:hypothetical protein
VFPLRYELNSYVIHLRSTVYKPALKTSTVQREKNKVIRHPGHGTNKDNAGEGQKQFTLPNDQFF